MLCLLVPAIHSPTVHLEVFSDSLLTEALGQDHHPPLQLVAQGHLSWSSLVLVSDGIEYWVLQENWVVLGHPGKETEMLCVRGCISIALGASCSGSAWLLL